MQMIDSNKVVPMLRLLLFNHPQANAIMNHVQELEDRLSVDAEPVRRAKWVYNHCTACGMMPMGDEMWKNLDFEPPLFERFMDYCPSCGAKMDLEVKNENQT